MTKQPILSLFFALLLLGLGQNTLAQISIGVRGGLLINNMKVDPLEDDEPDPESISCHPA